MDPVRHKKMKIGSRWRMRLVVHPWMRRQLRAQPVPDGVPVGLVKKRKGRAA
jgi:hypothetical protein